MKPQRNRILSWRPWFAILAVAALIVAGVLLALRWNANLASKEIKPSVASRSVCGTHCGTERWAVKMLSDEQVACVDFTPKQTTVSWLVSQQTPERLPEQSRSGTVECQVWELTGQLMGFKVEDDGDFHVVVADLDHPDLTMIVEIPDPSCSGACASARKPDIERARESFIQAFGAPPQKYHRVSGTVTVTVSGVGFFDFKHRQTGLATNGVELHPVMGFKVDASPRP